MIHSERLAIEHECTRLVIAYANLVDARSYETVAALWSDEAVIEGLSGMLVGRDDILRSLEARPPSFARHLMTNVQIEVLGPDFARGLSYFTLYRSQLGPERERPHPLPAPTYIGEYDDEFRLTPAGWRIARRKILLNFSA